MIKKWILTMTLSLLAHSMTARSETVCTDFSSVQKTIESQVALAKSVEPTEETLRKLYQSSGRVGLAYTLFYPQAFKGKVIMSSLAFDCYVNLKELTEQKTLSAADKKDLIQTWELCVGALYPNRFPQIAREVITCLKK